MNAQIKSLVKQVYKSIDKTVLFIAAVFSMGILYYINPFRNTALSDFDRTFCEATISGISFNKRIDIVYITFLIIAPLIFGGILFLIAYLIKNNEECKKALSQISVVAIFTILVSYISRYAPGTAEIQENHVIPVILLYAASILLLGFADKQEKVKAAEVIFLFVAYLVMIITGCMFLPAKWHNIYILLCFVFITVLAGLISRFEVIQKNKNFIYNFLGFAMWIPVLIRAALEVLYFLNQKGYACSRYFTYIFRVTLLTVLLCIVIALILKNRKINSTFYYLGAITSMGVLKFLKHSYQFVIDYMNYSNAYELGNWAVGADTILYGKLPIIDYFSAHALGDVWTNILYAAIYQDVKGVLANPYEGLTKLGGAIIIFFIVRALFNEQIAVLFTLLFPFSMNFIIITNICFLSVVFLIRVLKQPSKKNLILFWVIALVTAFYSYDNGIALGIGAIGAYTIFAVIDKKWKDLRTFIFYGALVGFSALILVFIYAVANDVSLTERIMEWFSVSVKSSSSWATASFGDLSAFAVTLSYLVAPMCAVVILGILMIRHMISRDSTWLAVVTAAFAITEIIYITRTIVFHNYSVCRGFTGVLLNVLHWTLAMYALYKTRRMKYSINKQFFVWGSVFLGTLVLECTLVIGTDMIPIPSADSTLYGGSYKSSENIGSVIANDDNSVYEQPRIIYSEKTTEFIKQFTDVFDTLLKEDETYIDFANMTSLYVMTGRERPCYVGQIPSLLTDLYSQECFLKQIQEYKAPLALFGATEEDYIQHMWKIPHNVRYYKIAEYLYNNYRPLVRVGDFAIWCENSKYYEYSSLLSTGDFEKIDYGYDRAVISQDEEGNEKVSYCLNHTCELGMVPYAWANLDKYHAINNAEILKMEDSDNNNFIFEGSKSIADEKGNYLAFKCTNEENSDIKIYVNFSDSSETGIAYEYGLTVVPGTNTYLIRVSDDYFWNIYNIDTIHVRSDSPVEADNVRILEGD